MLDKNKLAIALLIIAIALDFMHGELFFVLIFVYWLFIKLLLSDNLKGKFRRLITAMIWIVFAILAGLTFYVNNFMPHGHFYSTGEEICQNDGRGPCSEQYIEDTRNIDIPEWAKHLRTSGNYLLLFGLFFAAISSGKRDGNYTE